MAASSLKTEVKISPSQHSKFTGTKRKAEDVDNVKVEGDETPSSKRVALSITN